MAKAAKNESQLRLARSLNHVPWCEQYERMVSGMLYDSFTPDLERARLRARQWSHQYNSSFPINAETDTFATLSEHRSKALRQILGRMGDDVYIEPPFYIDYGCNISIGDRFYSSFNFTVLDCGLVTIGDRVMFGPNVSIYGATHETEVQSRRANIEFAKPVIIGDDCWIGGHTVILPGVEIGQGTTIGSGSVVSRSIPAWSVAMGTPARVVKKVTPLEAADNPAERLQ